MLIKYKTLLLIVIFFFNDTATTEIYTLSLHDALPISRPVQPARSPKLAGARTPVEGCERSEEHTSELQSQFHIVCRLLLEKKKKNVVPVVRDGGGSLGVRRVLAKRAR